MNSGVAQIIQIRSPPTGDLDTTCISTPTKNLQKILAHSTVKYPQQKKN